ncbi:MAG: polysaccharide deacetylase family protein [SAR324 cluster bacterium]|nr:polysaccharide deacetylase family protein [SAR324 cluster bacterium]
MKTPRIKYTPSWARRPLKPPPGGNLIVFTLVNVEHWVYSETMPRTVIPPPQGGSNPPPDIPNWSWKEYGWRCGLPRVMKILKEFGIRVTASINGDVCNAYPEMARYMNDEDWDFMGHGWVQTPMNKVSDERETLIKTKETIEAFTGKKMRGWMGPGMVETFDTPDLMKEVGIDWTCDFPIDDLPFEIETKHGPLVGLPYTFELNDIVVYPVEKHSSEEIYRRFRDGLPVYLEESKNEPRIMVISAHPYTIGAPHRIVWYRKMFEDLSRLPGVVYMTGSEIADWYLSQQ